MPTLDDEWLESNDKPTVAYLAFFDVLGWKERVRRGDLRQTAKNLRDLQAELEFVVAQYARGFEWGGIESSTEANIQVAFVSDSLLLYAYEDTGRCLVNLLRAAAGVVILGISRDIPFRGVVTRGQLFVSDDRKTALGEGLVRAYELEQTTTWMGGLVDTARLGRRARDWNALLNAAAKGLVWFYDCPTKDTMVLDFDPNLVVGWPALLREDFRGRGGILTEWCLHTQGDHAYVRAGTEHAFEYWSDDAMNAFRASGYQTVMESGEPSPPPPEFMPQLTRWAALSERTGFPVAGANPNDLEPL